jgi:hypothetical protein
MAKKEHLKILIEDAPIKWPNECAHCTGKEELVPIQAGIAKNTTSLWHRLLGGTTYTTYALQFPVCKEHAASVNFASWLTRRSPLPRLLRGYAYLIAPVAAVTLVIRVVIWLVDFVNSTTGRGTNSPLQWSGESFWFFTLLTHASLVMLALVIYAYRHAPVRLSGLEPDAVKVHFSNPRFARHFRALNKDIVIDT